MFKGREEGGKIIGSRIIGSKIISQEKSYDRIMGGKEGSDKIIHERAICRKCSGAPPTEIRGNGLYRLISNALFIRILRTFRTPGGSEPTSCLLAIRVDFIKVDSEKTLGNEQTTII